MYELRSSDEILRENLHGSLLINQYVAHFSISIHYMYTITILPLHTVRTNTRLSHIVVVDVGP